ncbi:MAG: FtsW/RodA/SpoVE family cell cycle protein [Erysipelotrichaceae bacterium]|nr:FtsW/RodA/SpoVE family cell cycle protein [Erysipelotrichaceae bacterium]
MKTRRFSLKLPSGGDLLLLLAMIPLMVIGLVMSASSAMTTDVQLFDLMIAVLKQGFFLTVGYIAYVWFSKHFSLDFFKRRTLEILFVSFVFVLIPLFFREINGAKAWIQIPLGFTSLTIQPSEFLKVISIVILAVYMGDVKNENAKLSQVLRIPAFFISALLIIIILLQSDLGSGLVLLGISVLVFLLSSFPKLKKIQWVFLGLTILAIIGAGLLLTPNGLAFLRTMPIPDYMVKRFENTIDPFLNRYGTGYQLVSSLMAFVKGDMFGVGFGKSLQKYGYLPAAQTDFILAVIAEEFGFNGVFWVSLITLFMVVRLMILAYRSTLDSSRMILAGVAYYILLHFILNVGGVSALIPLTGVPLLFISSGGSSTISIMIALGIAQRVISLERSKVKP